MKYLIYTLLILAIGLFGFNLFQLEWSHLLSEENSGPWIGILAALIVLVSMLILMASKAIQQKYSETKTEQ